MLVVLQHQDETITDSNLADQDYFIQEQVPLYKLAIFLYIHTEKLHHIKLKQKLAMEVFNAVYGLDCTILLLKLLSSHLHLYLDGIETSS